MHVDDVAALKKFFRIPLTGPGKVVWAENQLLLANARGHLIRQNIGHQGVYTPGVFLSNRGINIPLIDWQTTHGWALAAFVLGIVGPCAWSRAATRRQEATGHAAAGLAGRARAADRLPGRGLGGARRARSRSTCRRCAASTSPAAAPSPRNTRALPWASSSIPRPTSPRSSAPASRRCRRASGRRRARSGCGAGTVLRKIVLPQALRVIIPPMTSQYLNLTKNSSLAVAIGYQDIVSIASTTLNQTGQAIEGIAHHHAGLSDRSACRSACS